MLLHGEPTAEATAVFNSYTSRLEARLAEQHRTPGSFLVPADGSQQQPLPRMRQGEVILDQIAIPSGLAPGTLIHHWRGTAFVRGATASDFERLMRDFKSYPQHFSPDVIQASVLQPGPDHTLMRMRVRQQHVITVVLDGTYDVTFGQLDPRHGYSISRSVRMEEIASPGTPREHALSAQDEHGFLWRQNTYWSYEEADGGLYLQIESVSLTRSIPRGLGWAVRPYVESIPRESLAFTLRSARNAIRK